jgi:hypothetical protein
MWSDLTACIGDEIAATQNAANHTHAGTSRKAAGRRRRAAAAAAAAGATAASLATRAAACRRTIWRGRSGSRWSGTRRTTLSGERERAAAAGWCLKVSFPSSQATHHTTPALSHPTPCVVSPTAAAPRYEIFTFSRPAHPLAVLGYPVVRLLQGRFREQSARQVARAAAAGTVDRCIDARTRARLEAADEMAEA